MKSTFKFLFFTMSAVFLFSGCSTFSRNQCLNMDWYQIGYNEGFMGENKLDQTHKYYANTCGKDHEIMPNKETMTNGYKAGLAQFCSESGGKRAGSTGIAYRNVCGPDKEKEFMKSYAPARTAWLEENYPKLQARNKELQEENENLQSKVSRLQSEISSLESQISSLRSSCN